MSVCVVFESSEGVWTQKLQKTNIRKIWTWIKCGVSRMVKLRYYFSVFSSLIARMKSCKFFNFYYILSLKSKNFYLLA